MKITDFGLSRMVGPTSFMNTMCGTPQYLAPEVIGAKSLPNGYGKEVDLWSLGVILFVLNAGRMPFQEEEGGASILKQILEGLYVFDHHWDNKSKSLTNLVDRLLTVQPDLRATASEVMEHSWMMGEGEPSSGEVKKVHDARIALKEALKEKLGAARGPKRSRSPVASPVAQGGGGEGGEGDAADSRVDKKAKTSVPLSPTPRPNAPMCQYGDGCYRTNPQHFIDFAHPSGHPGPKLQRRV